MNVLYRIEGEVVVGRRLLHILEEQPNVYLYFFRDSQNPIQM